MSCIAKLHDICREDDVRTILVVGANPKQRCTQAVLLVRENMRAPHVYCFASKSFEALPNDAIEWLQFSSEGGDRIASSVAQLLRDGSIESFDVVVVDASEWPRPSTQSSGIQAIRTSMSACQSDNSRRH